MIEADPVFVEGAPGHRTQPEQRVSELVDHSPEQEPVLLTRGVVRVRWDLRRPASEDLLVKRLRPGCGGYALMVVAGATRASCSPSGRVQHANSSRIPSGSKKYTERM